MSVAVVERLGRTGGAAVSAQPFTGLPTRLSRYSYLVSLLPETIMADLGLDVRLASRSTASYTPARRGGAATGLLVERPEGAATRESFRALTGSDAEYGAWCEFYRQVAEVAAVVAPTLTEPLPRQSALRQQVDQAVWRDLVERPLGAALRERFRDETVRGVVATDALIGTFARLDEPSLVQNRCFLYHLIGNGTGEWRVPVGGMGAVTDALAARARAAGADLVTGTEVTAIRSGPGGAEVDVARPGRRHRDATVRARFALANVAPWVLAGLLGEERDQAAKPAGAQLKVNFLLTRLPRLASGVDPRVAFAGTLHLSEDYGDLERAYAQAAAGEVPDRLPGEVYCHSLTDPSILGAVPDGTHTLTYFGLHLPAALFADPATRAERKALAVARAIASLDEHLIDPVESVVARDGDGLAVHRGEGPAGHRGRPGHAGRPHLPRRPELALGERHRRAGHARRALGRRDRPGKHPALRLRRHPRRRGVRPGRAQRRAGGPRAGLTTVPRALPRRRAQRGLVLGAGGWRGQRGGLAAG